VYLIHSHRRRAIDLWEKAAQTLSDEDKLKFDFSRTNRLAILNDVLVAVEAKKQRCMDKRWKYTKHNGDVVILRDVFEKMVGWVNKFREVGDMAVQYDTAHAALPWAGIRLLLQVAVNDTETFGAMAEGVEFVSNLITRYTIVEQLYLQKLSTAKDQLMKAITKLYAALLKYLSKANRFYGRNSAGESSLIPCLRQVWPVDLFQERMALSIIRTAETGVEKYIKEISEMQVDVDACVALVEAACRLTLIFGPTVIRTLIKADREQMNEAVENTLGAIDAMGIGKRGYSCSAFRSLIN
jgi:N-terminal domain of NWD NACHT-NTPase